MESLKLDDYDKQILRILQDDATISNKELASRINLAPSSCLLRVKNLTKLGLIKRTVAILNEKKLGYDILAFVKVELKIINLEAINDFLGHALKNPQVLQCYMITGGGAFLMKIIAKDLSDYRDFVLNKLTSIDNVSNVETSIVMGIEKDTDSIPL